VLYSNYWCYFSIWGAFKAVVDRKYALEEITEAFKYVETCEKTGNVIINISKQDNSEEK